MSNAVPVNSLSLRRRTWIVVAMVAMVALPAAITLNTIRRPVTLMVPDHPTPHGYTWSLLLFVVPIVVIAFWFLPREGVRIPQRAFWLTIAILVPAGCGLDFFLARWFFLFPNRNATLGLGAPALGGSVPIEEYVFYLTGFMAVLLLYIWLDEYWLAAYNVPDYPTEAKKLSRLLRFHPASLVVGVSLIMMAIIYKKFFAPSPAGFPGYFVFLVVGALIPAASLFPTARSFINWQAFSITLFVILLISLLWEVTLALPYGWWGYQEDQMLGVNIRAWSRLPIEAVCVWIAVTYATTIVFEVVKIWLASGRTVKHAFLGW
jgi:hypothetical protein